MGAEGAFALFESGELFAELLDLGDKLVLLGLGRAILGKSEKTCIFLLEFGDASKRSDVGFRRQGE